MGGHGALVTALRNPGRYASVSAFSPIASPMSAPWGQKAFEAYLGSDKEQWAKWDAVELLRSAEERLALLVDVGGGDEFLHQQLKPHLLLAVCKEVDHPLELRIQPGFGHSYYFVATFLRDHFAHHAKYLLEEAHA